eukprot:364810-Chlamydomonas_euryale.AAC.16
MSLHCSCVRDTNLQPAHRVMSLTTPATETACSRFPLRQRRSEGTSSLSVARERPRGGCAGGPRAAKDTSGCEGMARRVGGLPDGHSYNRVARIAPRILSHLLASPRIPSHALASGRGQGKRRDLQRHGPRHGRTPAMETRLGCAPTGSRAARGRGGGGPGAARENSLRGGAQPNHASHACHGWGEGGACQAGHRR